MRRVQWYLFLMLTLLPRASSAIQLRWGSGSTDLTFTAATRCTLVVQADSSEQRLPSEWRVLWVADSSCSIQPLAIDSLVACEENFAQVFGVDLPTTLADRLANLIKAHFCSEGSSAASTAQYLFDLPGGSRGKLKVVPLDPSDPDSTRVIESPEVTFNGGVEGSYPPNILHTSTVHRSTEFRLSAVGAGLAGTRALTLVAADGSWQVPLSIASQGETAINASASLAANMPASFGPRVGPTSPR